MLGIERSELGGCRLIRRIGAGAMGEVYLAEQVALGNRLVAVKVVHAEHDVTPPPGAAEDVEWHFIREAQLLGQLTHPNILPVYHSGVEAGYLFLVMQYAPDGSLADAINGKGVRRLDLPASPPFVVDLIAQVANALQYTHDHHVIHADVKPSNVLVQVEPTGRWHVLLADFGIARSVDSIALRDEVAGTIGYMAPEQFYGQVSPACDQYALGVMAFQLLSGRLPFTGGLVELAQAHARGDPPALRALNPAIPPAVEAVIARALAKRPQDRHRSVAAFAQALRAASTGANTTLVAASNPGPAWAGLAVERRDAATARTAPAATWIEPSIQSSPAPRTYSQTVPFTWRTGVESPANTHAREGNARRRLVPGIAVLVLLLMTAVAGISLRSHIDVSHAFSSLGGGKIPTATGTPVSRSPTATPGTVAPAPGGPGPGPWPTPTPPAPVTPQPSSEATATPTAQPTATAPVPTTTPTTVPTPPATPTEVPQLTPTPTAQPTQPAATATPQPTAQPTVSVGPNSPTSVQPPPAPDMPAHARGVP
jgi:serine/threonine protein kinase